MNCNNIVFAHISHAHVARVMFVHLRLCPRSPSFTPHSHTHTAYACLRCLVYAPTSWPTPPVHTTKAPFTNVSHVYGFTPACGRVAVPAHTHSAFAHRLTPMSLPFQQSWVVGPKHRHGKCTLPQAPLRARRLQWTGRSCTNLLPADVVVLPSPARGCFRCGPSVQSL